jgi:hypothetical protein
MHNSTTGKDFYTCNDLTGNVDDQGCLLQIREANSDLQMGDTGPSGVNNGTPEPSLPPLSGDADEYGLSNVHHSHHIACHVEQVGLQ